MKSARYQSFFIILSLILALPLYGRSREDLLKLYQESTTAPKVKKRQRREKTAPATPSFLQKETEMATYFFTINSQGAIGRDLSWRVYYQGQIVNQKEGIFQFTAQKNMDTFDIVIAMIKRPEQTTISSLEVPENVRYVHYQLERAEMLANSKKYRWKAQRTTGSQGLMVPDDALVILLDPKYVKKLEVHGWEKNSDIIMLPTIILVNNHSLHEASVKTVLAALDTDLLHSRSELEQTQTDGVFISRIK